MKTFTCLYCNNTFPLKPGTAGKYCSLSHQMSHRGPLLKEKRIQKYNLSPKCCKTCFAPLDYEKRFNSFCDKSCSATFTNLNSSPNRKRGPAKNPQALANQPLHIRRMASRKVVSKTCIVCNAEFMASGNSSHCSKDCTYVTKSKKMKKYVSNNPSHKFNRNPYRQSYMEKSFEEWLISLGFSNSLNGYLKEVVFYNAETNKYGRADFVFPRSTSCCSRLGGHPDNPKRIS